MPITRPLSRPLTALLSRAITEAGGGGFSISQVFAAGKPGVAFDNTRLDTMWQDEAATIPAVIGQPMAKQFDVSGNGHSRSQSDPTKRAIVRDGGLEYDGVNDFYVSGAVDFSGTDKVTAWVGIRRDSSSGTGTVFELSSNFNNNDAFTLLAPAAANSTLSFGGKGNAPVGYSIASTQDIAFPSYSVLAMTHDRALATDEAVMQRNRAATTLARANNDNLAGNFTNAPLYFGMRGGTTLPFKGIESSVAIVGGAVTAAQLAQGAAWAYRRQNVAIAAAVGDSTVAAYLGTTAVIDLVGRNQPTNVAVAGHTIAQQKTAWLALASDVKLNQSAVFVQVGLNDMAPAEAASVAIARLQDLVATIRAGITPECKIYIAKMLPCRARWIALYGGTDGVTAQAKWVAMNEAIAGNGATPITGVDGRIASHVPLLDDGAGNLAAAYDSGDAIHPNNAGRQIIANAWRAQLVADGLAF